MNKSVTIRKIEDINDIDVLLNRSSEFSDFVYSYDKEDIVRLKHNFTRSDSLYLLAEQGDEFVGYCSTDSEWWEADRFFLREIFIDPLCQKHGLGKELIKLCIDHAKNCGAVEMVTETAYENIPMQKLCSKLGFKEWNNPKWKEGVTYKLSLQ